MSLIKGGGISARTKSLRDKFKQKRSFSELSFQAPSTSTSSLATSDVPSRPGSLRRPRSHAPNLFDQDRHGSTESISRNIRGIPGGDFNPTYYPQDAYSSALDINCQGDEPRFPWQRDAATQCDFGSHISSARSTSSVPAHPAAAHLLSPRVQAQKKLSSPFNFRFWKSSSPLSQQQQQQDPSQQTGPNAKNKPHCPVSVAKALVQDKRKSVLQRAVSFDSRGYSKLIQGESVDIDSPTQSIHMNIGDTEFLIQDNNNVRTPQVKLSSPTSGGGDGRRRKGKKMPNSAPDSFDEPSPPNSPREFKYDHRKETEILFDTPRRDLVAIQKPTLLEIPMSLSASQSIKNTHGYMNLPSPNVQGEDPDSQSVLSKKLSGRPDVEIEIEEPAQEEPPASALHRRQALVPPKLITDEYTDTTTIEPCQSPVPKSNRTSPNLLTEPRDRTRRRSSFAVIPQMQICPGDLMIYSKVLTNRNNLLENWDGSSHALTVDDINRKNKNTWSLLKLFDRSGRAKSDSLCGLEELLSTLTPSVFSDEQLSKYKGLSWTEFLAMHEARRTSSIVSGQHLIETISDDGSTKSYREKKLERHQTFDSSTHRETDELLAVAHSTRSHSCISPAVDVDVRRLSAGIDVSEAAEMDVNLGVISSVLPSEVSSTRSSFAVSRSEQKRRESLWDLFQSECNFLEDHLMVLKNVFMEPLKKIQVEGYAMFAEPEVLFGNLDELCCVTYAFCREFLQILLRQTDDGEFDAVDALSKLFQRSSKAATLTQAYHRYTLNYINALNYLESLRRQLEFHEFEKWCSRDSRCKKLQLQDLLVSPVQHVMRVPLILKDIESRTEDPSEKEIIVNIIESEEASLRELDDKMKWLKNFERLLEIQRNIQWPSVIDLDPKIFIPEFLKGPLSKQPCERIIVSPRRQIILEGAMNLLDSGKPVEMYLFLFDDMFVISRRKKGLTKKQSSLSEKWATTCSKVGATSSSHEGLYKYVVYKEPLSLDRFYIHDVTAQEGAASNLKHSFILVCTNRFQQVITCHTFQAPNDGIKVMWLTRLRDASDKWKRTLQNSVFRNQQRLSTASTMSTVSSQATRASSLAAPGGQLFHVIK